MRWIVTLRADTKQSRLKQLVEAAGGLLDADVPTIPIDGDIVVEVEGPANLPARIKDHPEVKAVHPSSEMSYY